MSSLLARQWATKYGFLYGLLAEAFVERKLKNMYISTQELASLLPQIMPEQLQHMLYMLVRNENIIVQCNTSSFDTAFWKIC